MLGKKKKKKSPAAIVAKACGRIVSASMYIIIWPNLQCLLKACTLAYQRCAVN